MNILKNAFLCSLLIAVINISVATAKTETLSIEGDHGKLSALLQTPDNKDTYPIIMLLHGFAADKDFFLIKLLATILENQGIASIRFDFNGHGESEGRFQDMTVPNEIEDTKKVYDYVKQLPKITSISLAGHSQGAVVAAMLAGELGQTEIKSIVLLSPAPNIKDNAQNGHFFGIKYDNDNLPEYITAPYGQKVGRDYLKTARELPLYEISEKYSGPVLIIHSAEDEIVPYKYAEEFNAIYNGNSTLKTIHNDNHNFTTAPQYVIDIVTDFITRQTQPQ